MIKKLLISTVTISLLSGCSLFEEIIGEKTILTVSLHSPKFVGPMTLANDSDQWVEFFKKEPVVVVEPGEKENDEETDADEEPTEPENSQDEAIPVVSNPTDLNVMVNKFWALPEGYRPPDLTRPNVPFSFGQENSDRSKLRQDAAQSLEMMFAAAKKEGIELYARSGFRSYETQAAIFQNEIAAYGYEQAILYVARPGTSEHQTGLAMDITAKSVQLELVETFETTAEGKWLAENAHHYGFILRYPIGKTNITGYAFEPWHYRYIGVKIATEIYTKGLTLEEYFGDVREL